MRLAARSIALLSVIALVFSACKSNQDQAAEFMDRGLKAVEEEKDDEAIIEFRNVIQLEPNHPKAHYELAQAYLRTQQLNDAYWELTESVRLDPDNTKARLSFGAMSMAVGEYEEALTQAEAVIAREPDSGGGWVLKGRALMRLDRFDEAEEPFRKAMASDPEDASYVLALAGFYLAEDDFDLAEPLYIQYTEMEPGFQSFTALARFLAGARDRDLEAEQTFAKAIESSTDDEETSDAYQNLAGFYFSRNRLDDAATTLRQGIEKVEDKLSLIYLLARFYSSRGDEEKADQLVEEATQSHPDDPRTFLVLSAYRGRKGDIEGALSAVEDALEVDDSNRQALLRKAELLVDIGFRNDALEKIAQGRSIVEEVLADEQTNPEALFVRAKIEIAEDRLEDAVVSLRSSLDGRPDWAQAHFVLGSAQLLLSDYQGARASVARSLELDAGMIEARRMLAAIHAQLGEYEYAIEQGRIYLRERPDHVKTRILVAQSLLRLGRKDEAKELLVALPDEDRDAESLYAIAKIYLGEQKFEEARELLLKANEMAPYHPEILKSLLGAESQLGLFEDAARRILDAVAANPENSKLVLLRAQTQMVAGDLAAAEASYQLASDLDPENLSAYQELAQFYRVIGRFDKAITTMEKSVSARPDSAIMQQRLAVLYEMDGQTEKAKEHYELALEQDANLAESKNNLAYLLAEEGEDLERALDLAQEAKALLPESPNAADTLGWVLYKRGVPAAAIGYLREAVAGMDPRDPAVNVVRQHLAHAYEANNEPRQAIQTLEEALASLEEQTQAALEQGRQSTEPAWAAEARATISRLRGQG